MSSIEEVRGKIERLRHKPKFEAMLQTTSILTSLLAEKNIQPIIVGGLAVEIYTRSSYTTADIDLIISRRDIADDLLKQLGFQKEGRHWYHDRLGIAIEIPNDVLEDADYAKVTKISLANEEYVYVIGIEDIILDRLRACVHWKSTSDCEWGFRLLHMHYELLDLPYIEKCVEYDLTEEQWKRWKQALEK